MYIGYHTTIIPHSRYLVKLVFTLRGRKKVVAKYTNFFEQSVSVRGRIFIDILCGGDFCHPFRGNN